MILEDDGPLPNANDGGVASARAARTVLVVDADEDHRELAAVVLDGIGVRVIEAATAGAAFAALETAHVDLVLTDIALPDHDGFQLLRAIRSRFPDLTVVVFSDRPSSLRDRSLEVFDAALPKPVEPAILRRLALRVGTLVRR